MRRCYKKIPNSLRRLEFSIVFEVATTYSVRFTSSCSNATTLSPTW
jgi:hypothetical protein